MRPSYHKHNPSELRDQRRYGKVIQPENDGRRGTATKEVLKEALRDTVAPFSQPTPRNRSGSLGIQSINESLGNGGR